MKNFLLLLALAAGPTLAAQAQTTEPATDASGVPLINKNLPAPGTTAPPAAPMRRAPLPPDQQAAGTRRGLGRAVQGNRAQADQQLRQVLSPDQYARYQQLLAQRRQQAQQRRQAGTGSSLLDD